MSEEFSPRNAIASRISGYVYVVGLGQIPIVRAFKDANTTGNTTIVAAQGSGQIIRVIFASVVCKSAVDVYFASNSTQISSTGGFGAGGGIIMPENVHGWFQTAADQALNVNLSGNVNVGVNVGYIVIN